MKIIISGLTAAGKTTHSKLLAQEFKLEYIHGSKMLGEIIDTTEKLKKNDDFWLTDESFQLDVKRFNNPENDFRLDELLVKTLEGPKDEMIFDVWTLPWLSKKNNSLRIWLESTLQSRTVKSMISIMKTSSFTLEDVAERLPIRDKNTRNFYLQYYNFDIFIDRSPFNFVVDTTKFVSGINKDPYENILKVHQILVAIVNWHQNPLNAKAPLSRLIDFYSDTVFKKIPIELTNT